MENIFRLLSLLLFALCFALYCLYPAEAQEASYVIRESQLKRLETDYQICRDCRQKAQQQVSDLQIRAKNLSQTCSDLQTLLAQERAQTKNLQQSVQKLGSSLQLQTEKYSKIQEAFYGLQEKVQRREKVIVVLSSVLTLMVLATAGYIFLKIRKMVPF